MSGETRSSAAQPSAVSLLLVWVGSALSVIWLQGPLHPMVVPPVALVLAVCWWIALTPGSRRPWLRRLALTATVGHHVLAAYLCIAFGVLLAWTTPLWFRGLAILLLASSVLPRLSRTRALYRVPLILPLGVWITGVLVGWYQEDGAVRCDDYRRMIAQTGVALVESSTSELAQCSGHEVLRVDRYPRRVWESPDGSRLVVTTQRGIEKVHAAVTGRRVDTRFQGSVCEVSLATDGHPECVGLGKAQLIMEDEPRGRLYVPVWSQPDPKQRGVLYEFPLQGAFHPLRELTFKENVQEGYYDRASDVLALTVDEGDGLHPVRASTMEPLPVLPPAVIPDETRFDPSRHEGVFCSGGMPFTDLAAVALAFDGWPPRPRPIGKWSFRKPWHIVLTWGCDFDVKTRRVYVTAANLGMLQVYDYDSGELIEQHFTGFGMRAVLLNEGRLYMANFLRGDVTETDPATGQPLRSWFVGRFVRNLSVSRDRKSLWTTSTLGVVRIALH